MLIKAPTNISGEKNTPLRHKVTTVRTAYIAVYSVVKGSQSRQKPPPASSKAMETIPADNSSATEQNHAALPTLRGRPLMIRHAILARNSPIRNNEALHFRVNEKFGSDGTENSAEHTFPRVIIRSTQPGTTSMSLSCYYSEYRCCTALQQYEQPPLQGSGHKTAVRL